MKDTLGWDPHLGKLLLSKLAKMELSDKHVGALKLFCDIKTMADLLIAGDMD